MWGIRMISLSNKNTKLIKQGPIKQGPIKQGMQRHLVVMAKFPSAGRVKTRLAKDIGTVNALSFYRQNLQNTLLRLGADNRWQTWLAVAPDVSASLSTWSGVLSACQSSGGPVRLLPQGHGGLGQRIAHVFKLLPPGPAVMIGSDIPDVSGTDIHRAFEELGSKQSVLGPSDDGGYWLIGLRRHYQTWPDLSGVRWSGGFARLDTMNCLRPKSTGEIHSLNDVDNGEDFDNWRQTRM